MINMIRLLSILALLVLTVVLSETMAKAETTRRTRTTTTTTVDSDDDGGDYAPPMNAAIPPPNLPPPNLPFRRQGSQAPPPPSAANYVDAQMSQTFGSKSTTGMAGCKTEAVSKEVIRDLKSECASWVKEQKSDLRENYLGNTCEDSCDDCGMSLVRCKVTGTIRYRKASDRY